MTSPSLEALESLYESHGVHNRKYLRLSYDRYAAIKALALPRAEGKLTVLDVGAHYLFNSMFYAFEGHRVIAADPFSDEEEYALLSRLAERQGIGMVRYKDLSDPVELDTVPESSVDLLLFTGLLGHAAFNPVRFWQAAYRVLKPGGRIAVTAPNYHHAPAMLKEAAKILRGFGGGIEVRDILEIHTPVQRWRLFTGKDLRRYASILSPDFRIARLAYFGPRYPGLNPKSAILKSLAALPMLRENVYCEWTLPAKRNGITATPHW